jgi:hypothetical protein
MVSKFSYNILGVIICFIMVSGVLIALIIVSIIPGPPPLAFMSVAVLIPILMLTWLVFGEFRTKAIAITLNTDHLIIRRYFGFGKPETIYYNNLDGFENSELASINMMYEYLYFVKGNKKIAKLSAYYHRNYAELKQDVNTKLKDLGEINFSYWNEVKEIFK